MLSESLPVSVEQCFVSIRGGAKYHQSVNTSVILVLCKVAAAPRDATRRSTKHNYQQTRNLDLGTATLPSLTAVDSGF